MTVAHHVVFDSQCDLCTELAQRMAEHSGGRIVPLSIRDPRAIRLLDRARPRGWVSQPYLVAVRGERPSAVSGLRLALRTARLVGLARSWSLLQAMRAAARRRRDR